MNVTPITKVSSSINFLHFLFSGVYGEPRVDRQIAFWNELSQMHTAINHPWIVMRDLNIMLPVNESKYESNSTL